MFYLSKSNILNLPIQFDCVNTLSDQLLENVRVDLVLPDGFVTRAVIPCTKLPYGEKEATYVIVEFPPDLPNSIGKHSRFNNFWNDA